MFGLSGAAAPAEPARIVPSVVPPAVLVRARPPPANSSEPRKEPVPRLAIGLAMIDPESSRSRAPEATVAVPVPRAAELAATSVPAEMTVPPWKVFEPERVSVPGVSQVKPPVPPMSPERVAAIALNASVSVPDVNVCNV